MFLFFVKRKCFNNKNSLIITGTSNKCTTQDIVPLPVFSPRMGTINMLYSFHNGCKDRCFLFLTKEHV